MRCAHCAELAEVLELTQTALRDAEIALSKHEQLDREHRTAHLALVSAQRELLASNAALAKAYKGAQVANAAWEGERTQLHAQLRDVQSALNAVRVEASVARDESALLRQAILETLQGVARDVGELRAEAGPKLAPKSENAFLRPAPVVAKEDARARANKPSGRGKGRAGERWAE